MVEINRETVLAALKNILVPGGARDVVSAGLIQGLVIRAGKVGFSVEVDPREGPAMEPLRAACEQAVQAVPGVQAVTAVLTAERAVQPSSSSHDHAGHSHAAPGPKVAGKIGIEGVKTIIAVASGKGGVGKSTTSVNLALAFKALGLSVGLLDADIYGPSIPRMMGITGRPVQRADKKIMPMVNHGMPCMSIGFLVPEETATIWRGPMVMGALQQLMYEVAWNAAGNLDILVIDLPPGTGDAQLTMAQRVPLAGAVIVSTPQDIALIDARKGIDMFNKVNVPILGILENMSYFLCPHCGERSDIFGHGGARETATQMGAAFLGEVPLHIDIRKTSDSGDPIVASKPESTHALAYIGAATRVLEQLAALSGADGREPPRIIFE